MFSKLSRIVITTSLALIVFLTHSVVLSASPTRLRVSEETGITQTDDEDDGLSGGALAVLLLAIGGAVAGVLYASTPAGPKRGSVSVSKSPGSIQVKNEGSGGVDNRHQTAWQAKLNSRSQIVELTNDSDNPGQRIHSRWSGKLDGKFYPVTGDPKWDEWSFTKLNSRTIKFTARKSGRVVETGQIALSGDGKSYTTTRN